MKNDDFINALYGQMTSELRQIRQTQINVMRLAKESFNTVRSYTIRLREYILARGFHSEQEEILFFKETKPGFYRFLIYFAKLIQLELAKPIGSEKEYKKYLEMHQNRLIYFFKKYKDFYKYLRSDTSHLDKLFFLRVHQDAHPHPELEGVDKDHHFSTSHDFLVAKVSANKLLDQYLGEEISRLASESIIGINNDASTLSWTSSKAALTELLYALSCKGVFNQGNSSLQQIASFFERVFNVKLGNYYRAFQELRIRKKNRTQFLDELKKQLIEKMDYDDEHPR